MEAIIDHFKQLRANGDEMAWMMMISFLNRHYHHTHADRKVLLKRLKNQLPESYIGSDQLNKLGNFLIEKQEDVLPDFAQSASHHQNLSELYMKYDQLKMDHFHLLNKLRTQKNKLKTALELKNRI